MAKQKWVFEVEYGKKPKTISKEEQEQKLLKKAINDSMQINGKIVYNDLSGNNVEVQAKRLKFFSKNVFIRVLNENEEKQISIKQRGPFHSSKIAVFN